MSSIPPSKQPGERTMSVLEAMLWTFASIYAASSLHQLVLKVQPSLKDDPATFTLCQAIGYLILLVVIQSIYFRRTSLREIFAARRGSWVFYPIAALLGVAILIPTSALYEAALARWPDTAQGTEILKAFQSLPPWRKVAAGVAICVVTPLVEEALFRGALFGTLRRRHPAAFVVALTGCLFAIAHVQPQLLLPIAMVGGALAFLRVASGSIWPGVVLHVAFNGFSFYLQMTSDSEAEEPTPALLIVAGTVVTAGLLALTEHLRSKKVYTAPDIQHRAEPEEER